MANGGIDGDDEVAYDVKEQDEYDEDVYGGEDDSGELNDGEEPRLEAIEELEETERAIGGGRSACFNSDTRRNTRSYVSSKSDEPYTPVRSSR
jgi:hypothetical protein